MTSTNKSGRKAAFAETVRVVVHALIIAVVIRTFLFQPFNIPSGSMKATLLVGDYLFVSKYTYGYSRYSFPFSPPLFTGRDPLLGRPAARRHRRFRLPRDNSTDYIKRVIGLPGDRIQMIDGVLQHQWRAGQARARRRLRRRPRTGPASSAIKRWQETLPNGVGYYTLDLRRQRRSTTTRRSTSCRPTITS